MEMDNIEVQIDFQQYCISVPTDWLRAGLLKGHLAVLSFSVGF